MQKFKRKKKKYNFPNRDKLIKNSKKLCQNFSDEQFER